MRAKDNAIHPASKQLIERVEAEMSAGRHDSALALIDAAASTIAHDVEVRIKRGAVLRRLGRIRESVEHLRDLHGDHPNNVGVLNQLAASQRLAGDIDASDALLDAALALRPRHRGALLGKVSNSKQRADRPQTLDRARHAFDVHPNDLPIAVAYGLALRDCARLEQSADHFEALADEHRDDAGLRVELSRVRMMQGRYEQALEHAEVALHIMPGHPQAIAIGIQCALQSGRLMHAIRLAQDAVLYAQSDCSAAIRLANLYRIAGWPQMAIEILEGVSEGIGAPPQAVAVRADSLADLGRLEDALGQYAALRAEDPLAPHALYRTIDLAVLGVGDETPRDVLDALGRDLAKSGEAGRSSSLLLEAMARAGDWAGLLEQCESPRSAAPAGDDGRCYFEALARFASGDPQSAKCCMSRHLESNPGDIRGRMLLADIELSLGNREASLAVRQAIVDAGGLAGQDVLLLHAVDLFGLGRVSEARDLFASLKAKDGYYPSSSYLNELLRQGETAEVADCRNQVSALRERLPARSAVRSQRVAGSSAGLFIGASQLRRLFDFGNDEGLFGNTVYPAAFLAWRLSGSAYGDYPQWSRKAMQATQSSAILFRTPARDEDLEAFIERPDLSLIMPLVREGRGFILVSTHMGPAVGTYLTRRIPGMTYFQSVADSTSVEAVGALGIGTAGNSREAAIAAVRALRSGQVLSAAPDVDIRRLMPGDSSSSATASATARLFGLDLRISNVVPKLSRELGVPTYWFQPHWKDGRIRFDIEAMPLAEVGEQAGDWHDRWAQAYLGRLEALMLTGPENQNLNAPLWRDLLFRARESAVLAPLLD